MAAQPPKGQKLLGFEDADITEIKGADELYEAEGIIAESEANATKLFGTAHTYYSTEGSSQYTARDSGRKINRNCTEENAIQTAPFQGFFGDSQKVYMCYNSL